MTKKNCANNFQLNLDMTANLQHLIPQTTSDKINFYPIP